MIAIILGILLAVPFIYLLEKLPHQKWQKTLGLGLVAVAFIYVFFAIFNSEIEWAIIELLGVAIFAVAAYPGIKKSIWFLALGWAAHVIWDIGLHSSEHIFFVPSWYPNLCIGFDLFLAVYIIYRRNQYIEH
ncbi:MAG: DUF6010 family protein [Candidatus Thiodiazotropha endolucinida]